MKFNEKLIKLRKEHGYSQEQLGYELNVTRQTVSKWELGISTPDMEKLVEISKLFGVNVDDLVNDSSYNQSSNTNTNINNDGSFVGVDSKYIPKDKNYNNTNNNSSTNTSYVKKDKKGNKWVIIIILIPVIIMMLIFLSTLFTFFNFKNSSFKNFNERVNEGINNYNNSVNQLINNKNNNVNELINNHNNNVNELIKENINNTTSIDDKKEEVQNYNDDFTTYGGSNTSGNFVETLINKIVTNNNSTDNKISITFNGNNMGIVKNYDEITIDRFSNYSVNFNYNDEGYIIETIIKEK